MIIVDVPQQSEEWFKLKAGIPSASCFDKIMTPKTRKSSESAKNYMYQLAGERLLGNKAVTFQTKAMERGTELEADAREMFAFIKDVEVQQVGVVFPDEEKKYLCSPDGIKLEDRIGLEIKCPLLHTHVSYLLAGELPTDYKCQVQGAMLVTGFESWFFMSYYPGVDPLIIEVKRDIDFISELSVAVLTFCRGLDEITDKLRKNL